MKVLADRIHKQGAIANTSNIITQSIISVSHHRQGTNACVKKYIEQLLDPAPLCSSNSNV